MRDRVITKSVIDMETMELIYEESFPYAGQWDLCIGQAIGAAASIAGGLLGGGGAPKEDKQLAAQQKQFFENLQAEQSTQFAQEQDAQNQIKQMWDPIAKGGAYQYGFSTAEDQQLQKNIEEAGTQATQNTVAAEQLRQQQLSGGAATAPTGAAAALEEQARQTGAQKTATALGQEKELGYETGRELFEKASNAEATVAQLANPTGYAQATTNAGNAALAGQQQVDTLNAQSSTAKLLGGALQGTAVQGLLSKIPGSFNGPSVGNLPMNTAPGGGLQMPAPGI